MPLNLQQQDRLAGRRIKELGGIKDVVFSNRTYQVEVQEKGVEEPLWVVLDLDASGAIQDGFCSCVKAEYTQSCQHLAAGALAVFQENKPIGQLYAESILHHLFFMAARRHGFDAEVMKRRDEKSFSAKVSNPDAECVITLKSAEAKQRFHECCEKPAETEGNSIKFFNLSPEEMKRYRDGNASFELRFNLSFWSDFSKWVFVRSLEKADITVRLIHDEQERLKGIEVDTTEMGIRMGMADMSWSEVVPALKPYVPVHDFVSFELDRIVYDEKLKRLQLIKKSIQDSGLHGLMEPLGDYRYIKGRGFFPREDDEIFAKEFIEGATVAYFFRRYPHLIERYLQGAVVHQEKKPGQYLTDFDDLGNFHIELYVDTPHDLTGPGAGVFLPYVYLPGKGFYCLKNVLFEAVKKVIPAHQMGYFIDHYKHWLNQFDGFQIHLNAVDAALSYEVNAAGQLVISAQSKLHSDSGLVDLGLWCYLKGSGFFPKSSQRHMAGLQPGVVEKESIGAFIAHHHLDLESVSGFFLHQPVIKALGLKVVLNKDKLIEVAPKMICEVQEHEGRIEIYGGYGYLKGEGFFQLPDGKGLPRGYEVRKIIPAYLEEQFLHFEWKQIQNYIVECDPRLKRPERGRFIVEGIAEEESRKFKVMCSYVTEYGKTPLADLVEPYLSHQTHVATDAGLVFFHESSWQFLGFLSKRNVIKSRRELRLTLMDWIKLSVFMQPEFSSGCPAELVALLKGGDAAMVASGEGLPLLAGFKSQLRPYQETGLKWLWHLYTHQLSGILADDMGLGKTHQAMALIAASMNRREKDKKYLVVCPTSVIYHWQNLLKTYLPFADVLFYYGAAREMKGFDGSKNILLTSYGTLRSDIKALGQITFELAVFDEMHIAKNQHSQVHKCLKKVQAEMKVGLTGTPIENDLMELRALFDIVLPQYLPDSGTFKEQFILPIEKMGDETRKVLLKKLIAPFVLRRKKTEVLHDLPEKIEEISTVDLSDEQRVLYRKIVEERKILDDESAEENFFLHVFQLFNKLKQLCNHPALLLQDVANYKNYASGKFELFKERLSEALSSDQKVVVFSQYLGMLDIFRLYLEEEGIGFAEIRGSTKDRKRPVEQFQNDPSCKVFLASLQAAGVGIDLVAASVVIHYDRWWNPAKENQATDRVHRIGQRRGVQVFKLVSKDTIEEHIDEMILKKRHLAESVVDYDEQFEVKKIDRSELLKLLYLVKKDCSH